MQSLLRTACRQQLFTGGDASGVSRIRDPCPIAGASPEAGTKGDNTAALGEAGLLDTCRHIRTWELRWRAMQAFRAGGSVFVLN